MHVNKVKKQIKSDNLPLSGLSAITPFLVYTAVDYWGLPMWLFAVYMTVWVLVFISTVYVNVTSVKIDLLEDK